MASEIEELDEKLRIFNELYAFLCPPASPLIEPVHGAEARRERSDEPIPGRPDDGGQDFLEGGDGAGC